MNTKLLSKSTIAVALLVAFFLGGVSARLWWGAPTPSLKDVQANQEKREESDHEHQGERGEHEEEKLKLSAEAQTEAGITLAEATGGELEQTLNLPGALTLNADTVLDIVPRVAGIVQRVNKTLGDEVKPGEVLAVIESRELAETKAAYLAAKQRLALAQATLASAEELKAKRILPGLEYSPPSGSLPMRKSSYGPSRINSMRWDSRQQRLPRSAESKTIAPRLPCMNSAPPLPELSLKSTLPWARW